jgi:hypothetical protein
VATIAARILLALTGLLVAACGGGDAPDSEAAGAANASLPRPLTIPEEVERMKNALPSQSHLMTSVGYHWSELWFAAQNKEWELAQSHFDEARQDINWMITIHPTRADAQGNPVNLKTAFDPVDSGAFAAVKQAIARKDGTRFGAAYRRSLEGCYSCHKISGRPYLRPMVPTTPAPTSMNDSNPDGPQASTLQSRAPG